MNSEPVWVSAERSVIGAGLIDPDVLRFAAEHITPRDFADARLGAAFDAMLTMRTAGEPIDEQTVAARLAAGPMKLTIVQLFDCREQTPTAQNVARYAEIVADAAGKRRLAIFAERAKQAATSNSTYADLMTDVRSGWEQLASTATSGIDAPLLRDVLDGPDDYDWLIPNLLERRDRLVVTGSEGSGKSYWIQQLAILAAAGIHPTTFRHVTPVRVLVVDAENSAKQWRRRVRPLVAKAAQVGQVNPADTLRLATVPRLNVTNERDLASVHRLIDEHIPDILVIGPLYRLIPRAIQSDDDAAPLITALDSLRARGPALIMEAHAGHARDSKGDRDLRPRGSSALMGWPEFGFGLRLLPPEVEGAPVQAELMRWRGDRDQRAWPTVMERGGIWPWTDSNPDETQSKYENRYHYERTA